MLVAGSAFSAAAWAFASALGWLPLTVPLLAVAFVPVGVTNVLFVSTMQALVPEASLGRVMALVGSVWAGATRSADSSGVRSRPSPPPRW